MKKSVFITGSSSGLGKETAIRFAEAGYRVFAGVRNVQDAEEISAKYKSVTPVVLDLRDRVQIASAAQKVIAQCGDDGLGLLINMAGYTFVAPIEYTDENDVRDLFDVTVLSPAFLTKALLPALKKHFNSTGIRAKVINIISWASLDASPFVGYYSAAKAAFLRLSEAQSFEFAQVQVDAIAILPGMMKTPFVTEKAGREIASTLRRLPEEGKRAYAGPLRRMADMGRAAQSSPLIPTPDKIAAKIFKIAQIGRPKYRYLIGTDSHIVDFMNRHFPLRVLAALKRRLYALQSAAPSLRQGEKRPPVAGDAGNLSHAIKS
jgi:NAD(P)-dependent dehydrogenase (short-subunit alcohol dehydrogenase family)